MLKEYESFLLNEGFQHLSPPKDNLYQWINGDFVQVANFDEGGEDYVTIPNTKSIGGLDQWFIEIEGVFYADSLDASSVYFEYGTPSSASTPIIGIYKSGSTADLRIEYDDQFVGDIVGFYDDGYHKIRVEWDSPVMKVYMDDILVITTTETPNVQTVSSIELGARASTRAPHMQIRRFNINGEEFNFIGANGASFTGSDGTVCTVNDETPVSIWDYELCQDKTANGLYALRENNTFLNSSNLPTSFQYQDSPFTIIPIGNKWGLLNDSLDFMKNGGTTYFVSKNGNDSNDGLTILTPKATITSAYNTASSGDTISIQEGNYYTDTLYSGDIVKNIDLIGEGDVKLIAGHQISDWVSYSANTYESNTNDKVVDRICVINENYDLVQELTLVADVASVDTTPYSYRVDSGNIYINTQSDPNAQSLLILDDSQHVLKFTTGASSCYAENLKCYGGQSTFLVLNGVEIGVESCEANFATAGDCFNTENDSKAYFFNCISKHSFDDDGFDYRDTCKAVEYKCLSYGHGNSSTNFSNSSTGHGNCRIIRIDCDYRDSYGPLCVDVNTTETAIYSCRASGSLTTGGNKADFYGANSSKMWMIGCLSTGDYVDAINAVSTSTVEIKNTRYTNKSSFVVEYVDPINLNPTGNATLTGYGYDGTFQTQSALDALYNGTTIFPSPPAEKDRYLSYSPATTNATKADKYVKR